mmetsp:Transcript_37548/g.60544  ORF Transcript_37548/g.60544 Transcript_37548/m.60544 type:complete len:208 (-) Transcript_37548:1993-2616(-)
MASSHHPQTTTTTTTTTKLSLVCQAVTCSYVDFQGQSEREVRTLLREWVHHDFLHDASGLLSMRLRPFQDELVVDLHHNAITQLLETGLPPEAKHRCQDDVCSGALHSKVHRCAHGSKTVSGGGLLIQQREHPPAAQQRHSSLSPLAVRLHVQLPLANLRLRLVPGLHQHLGIVSFDAQLLSQSYCRHPIHDAEVDGLGAGPLLGKE